MKPYILAAAASIILVVVLFIAGRKISEIPSETVAAADISEVDKDRRALLSYIGLYYYYTEGYLNLCNEYGVDVSQYRDSFIQINAELDKLADERAEALNIDRKMVYEIIQGEHPNSFRLGVKTRLEEDNTTGEVLCNNLLKEIAENPELFDLMKLLRGTSADMLE
ncbi:MAG: hypothetical protein LBP51_02720 [Deferribacteraceae bacterium]|jgi:hypothetical protein|nr:hypothetical protein [Deferribacteraceae bacterium]